MFVCFIYFVLRRKTIEALTQRNLCDSSTRRTFCVTLSLQPNHGRIRLDENSCVYYQSSFAAGEIQSSFGGFKGIQKWCRVSLFSSKNHILIKNVSAFSSFFFLANPWNYNQLFCQWHTVLREVFLMPFLISFKETDFNLCLSLRYGAKIRAPHALVMTFLFRSGR